MTHIVVLGGGSSAEAFVAALRRHDTESRVTMIERELVGGECTYWACMPSKTLLRATELVAAAELTPGVEGARLDPAQVFDWRDKVVDGWQDEGHEPWLAERDVELVRGDARVLRPGVLVVDGEELTFDKLVLATGSLPIVPPIPGIETVEHWTSREATSATAVPESLVVLGAGAVGCELAQFYRRLGARVAIVDRNERLLPREHPTAGELIGTVFEGEGIALHLSASVERIEPGVRVHLGDGTVVEGERLLVATGRRPNVDDLGLEQLGVEITKRGVTTDERLRAADNVWAIGDVTGVAAFTHVGKYQARIAAGDVAGEETRADYTAIPRVTFTDPQVAAVGSSGGDGLVESEWRVDRTARTSTYERPKRPGFVRLFADPDAGVLRGAVAVGPEAGEWLGQLTLAVRAGVPIATLRDTIQPYPTFSEAIHFAARDLPLPS
jgi:pyruvate/2-oxoglutarate dehydrogenase complex dihydrolipoamide dehydrogenase (E3) component